MKKRTMNSEQRTMGDCCMKYFVEQEIIEAVRKMLTGRVNEMLGELELQVPVIEFSGYSGGAVVCPVISISSCERTEKERIILTDAYSLTIAFSLPDSPESEMFCYSYSGAVSRVFYDDPTLGGVVDRAVVIGKKYLTPKNATYGEGWGLVLTLRVTVEEMI
jgi:hypothetical protein